MTPTPAFSCQVDVAKGIQREIELANVQNKFSQPIHTVHRQYGELDIQLKLQDGLIRVDIVPSNCRILHADRESLNYLVTTSIGIRKKYPRTEHLANTGEPDIEDIDKMMILTQEIHDYFAPSQPNCYGRELNNVPEAAWSEGGTIEAPIVDFLSEKSMFLGIVKVLYSVLRIPNLCSE